MRRGYPQASSSPLHGDNNYRSVITVEAQSSAVGEGGEYNQENRSLLMNRGGEHNHQKYNSSSTATTTSSTLHIYPTEELVEERRQWNEDNARSHVRSTFLSTYGGLGYQQAQLGDSLFECVKYDAVEHVARILAVSSGGEESYFMIYFLMWQFLLVPFSPALSFCF
jgi:hypothetical protein